MVKFLIGPILFFILLLLPTSFNSDAQIFLAIFSWVVCNWLFTDIPLFVSGILGVCLSVLFQITTPTEALAPFASPTIFLFLSGFLFARAMNSLGLDKKMALIILNFPFIRGNSKRIIIASFFLTAWFSMWISNTATTAMMLPIFIGIIDQLNLKDIKFRSTLLLGLAYSATIGGLGTPIGSPPNMIAISFLKELANIHFTFFDWFYRGFPLVILFTVFLCYYTLKKIELDEKVTIMTLPHRKISAREIYLIILFSVTVIGWLTPGFISLFKLPFPYLENLNAEVLGLFTGSLLFIFPFKGHKILTTEDMAHVDWSTLLLFGSGISLGKILFSSGVAQTLAHSMEFLMQPQFASLELLILIYITIFATELASNTATANILIPIVIAIYLKSSVDLLNPVIGVALASSLAFMLPVGTPPNAIVYGTKQVNIQEMMRMGLWLNIIFGIVIYLILKVF